MKYTPYIAAALAALTPFSYAGNPRGRSNGPKIETFAVPLYSPTQSTTQPAAQLTAQPLQATQVQPTQAMKYSGSIDDMVGEFPKYKYGVSTYTPNPKRAMGIQGASETQLYATNPMTVFVQSYVKEDEKFRWTKDSQLTADEIDTLKQKYGNDWQKHASKKHLALDDELSRRAVVDYIAVPSATVAELSQKVANSPQYELHKNFKGRQTHDAVQAILGGAAWLAVGGSTGGAAIFAGGVYISQNLPQNETLSVARIKNAKPDSALEQYLSTVV
ncbi:MAG TPA: hypothetical protein VK158_02875, partial [Acidobacteriota bacterium]|nr:hypothetical protein [Acidobacteriota bacterium]